VVPARCFATGAETTANDQLGPRGLANVDGRAAADSDAAWNHAGHGRIQAQDPAAPVAAPANA
jgi:hypothetical protein